MKKEQKQEWDANTLCIPYYHSGGVDGLAGPAGPALAGPLFGPVMNINKCN